MRKIEAGKKYRHFKGSEYIVLAIAMHTETEELLVVYQNIHDKEKIYARPYDMFAGEVDREKYPEVLQHYRFEEI
ncbi:MAG: DUF1653 domain-containing protein [Clostridiales bacterium]|nr:DUF1653 domain-containing protein [Clostridiales bacterium]